MAYLTYLFQASFPNNEEIHAASDSGNTCDPDFFGAVALVSVSPGLMPWTLQGILQDCKAGFPPHEEHPVDRRGQDAPR